MVVDNVAIITEAASRDVIVDAFVTKIIEEVEEGKHYQR